MKRRSLLKLLGYTLIVIAIAALPIWVLIFVPFKQLVITFGIGLIIGVVLMILGISGAYLVENSNQ